MGMPGEGPACIFGDNQSVLCNTVIPNSTLKKKSQSAACHLVREGATRDESRTDRSSTNESKSDVLTTPLSGEKIRGLFNGFSIMPSARKPEDCHRQ